MRLSELFDRIEECNDRYWDIPKVHRIEHGLRPKVYEIGYSGTQIVELCSDLLSRAFRGMYPFKSETLAALVTPGFPEQFNSPEDVVGIMEPMINELEQKLDGYETSRQST